MLNQIKTVLFLGILTAILLFIGSFFGRTGLTIAFIFVLAMNLITYFFSDKIVLKMYRAKEISRHEAPKLYDTVQKVVQKANLPMPKVYIVPTDNPNAFCVGRNPKHASIAFTQGILDLLSEEELKGVAAHELAHDKNRDILIATIAATIAGVISYIAFMARWAAIFGGMGRDRDSGNVLQLLVLAIIAPITAMIIQLAISRSREYLADESAAKLTHNPLALATALEKLEQGSKTHPLRFGSPSASSLFIVRPFSGSGLLNLLSTHPPIHRRVEKLKKMNI